jgi:hypothetical protein
MKLTTNDDWQTPTGGKLEQEYAIYAEQARRMGWVVKTFDEWLES